MLRIKPFCALRPKKELCPKVASLPYDVVNRDEAYALAHENPFSFLHVSRAEIDLPEKTDPYAPEVYRKAADNFKALQERGILIRDPQPCFYIYRLKRNERYQHGIVACCHVHDYEKNIIKKHEKTRVDKEEDRKKHTAALRAHSGPVFLTYRDNTNIDAITREAEQAEPLYDFTSPDGISHSVWQIPATEALREAFEKMPAAYIADGHHRAAAGVGVARELAQGNNDLSIKVRFDPEAAEAECNWFLTVLFPASQLEILPYNRGVRDLAGMDAGQFLEAVKRNFNIEENAAPVPARTGQISMYIGNRWYALEYRGAPKKDLVAALDVSILQSELLDPVLGIKDPRTDKRIDFIGGIHGTHELESKVNSGAFAAAFSMFPVNIQQLLAISDAGQIMPPKSTWFEPKLRDAFLIHTF